jgi:signal transduction histidine kinase
VAVRDYGIGIPSQALPHLFSRFYRAENTQTQQIGGIGLGLYVVHEIVSLHGGDIQVTSTEGQGSTFTIRLPLISEQNP